MPLIASGKTDIGQKRASNQDAIYLNREINLFIVADGMGGHNGGDIASAMAVGCIPEYTLSNLNDDPISITTEAIRFANKSIWNKGAGDEKLSGMGTTAVTMFFKGETLYIGNVGDSRAYLINKNKLYQMTIDHSLVQEKLQLSIQADLGNYNREKASLDPQKNIIVRTVGFEDNIEVDTFTYKVNKNDVLLSCSDGLYGKVSDGDITFLTNKIIPDPSKATQQDLEHLVDQLISHANTNGGNDNISVIVVIAQ